MTGLLMGPLKDAASALSVLTWPVSCGGSWDPPAFSLRISRRDRDWLIRDRCWRERSHRLIVAWIVSRPKPWMFSDLACATGDHRIRTVPPVGR